MLVVAAVVAVMQGCSAQAILMPARMTHHLHTMFLASDATANYSYESRADAFALLLTYCTEQTHLLAQCPPKAPAP
jgi:hypothetical protein